MTISAAETLSLQLVAGSGQIQTTMSSNPCPMVFILYYWQRQSCGCQTLKDMLKWVRRTCYYHKFLYPFFSHRTMLTDIDFEHEANSSDEQSVALFKSCTTNRVPDPHAGPVLMNLTGDTLEDYKRWQVDYTRMFE